MQHPRIPYRVFHTFIFTLLLHAQIEVVLLSTDSPTFCSVVYEEDETASECGAGDEEVGKRYLTPFSLLLIEM